MRVTIETTESDESFSTSIERNSDDLNASEVLRMCVNAMVGQTFHPHAVQDALEQIAEEGGL